jgi:hypothetical protein
MRAQIVRDGLVVLVATLLRGALAFSCVQTEGAAVSLPA